MRVPTAVYILVIILVEFASSAIFNSSIFDPAKLNDDIANNKTILELTRRRGKKKKVRSTSSSSGEKRKSKDDDSEKESLEFSSTSSSSSTDEKKKKKKGKYKLKSSLERTGWHKFHRKCTPCPEEQRKKWRDPSIEWICGAYQRARRSFKSICMMRLRNCQDGTMFIKISEGRCANSSKRDDLDHGEHFFYDYKVRLSMDSSTDSSDSETTSSDDSSSSSIEWDTEKSNELKRLKIIG